MKVIKKNKNDIYILTIITAFIVWYKTLMIELHITNAQKLMVTTALCSAFYCLYINKRY